MSIPGCEPRWAETLSSGLEVASPGLCELRGDVRVRRVGVGGGDSAAAGGPAARPVRAGCVGGRVRAAGPVRPGDGGRLEPRDRHRRLAGLRRVPRPVRGARRLGPGLERDAGGGQGLPGVGRRLRAGRPRPADAGRARHVGGDEHRVAQAGRTLDAHPDRQLGPAPPGPHRRRRLHRHRRTRRPRHVQRGQRADGARHRRRHQRRLHAHLRRGGPPHRRRRERRVRLRRLRAAAPPARAGSGPRTHPSSIERGYRGSGHKPSPSAAARGAMVRACVRSAFRALLTTCPRPGRT